MIVIDITRFSKDRYFNFSVFEEGCLFPSRARFYFNSKQTLDYYLIGFLKSVILCSNVTQFPCRTLQDQIILFSFFRLINIFSLKVGDIFYFIEAQKLQPSLFQVKQFIGPLIKSKNKFDIKYKSNFPLTFKDYPLSS